MEWLTLWNVLGIVAILSLIIFGKGRSSIWGGLTIGAIIGLIISIIYLFIEPGFQWSIIKKSAIIGTLCGLIADLLGKFSNKRTDNFRDSIDQ